MTNQRSWFKTYQPINKREAQLIEGIGGVEMRAKRFGNILVRVKNSDNYEMNVLTNVLHVLSLGKSLFSCFKIAQKNTLTSHMKDDYQLIQKGNVVMTRVTKGVQLNSLKCTTQDEVEVVLDAFFNFILYVYSCTH